MKLEPTPNFVVTIDGPVAAGKGTIARLLSERFHFLHIEAGLMYRSVAFLAHHLDISNADIGRLVLLAKSLNLRPDGTVYTSYTDSLLSAEQLKTPDVDRFSPQLATIVEMREAITAQLRQVADRHSVVIDGKDTGTAVFPNADVKIYLDASFERRVQRRARQYWDQGILISQQFLEDDTRRRDVADMERLVAPLSIPIGAYIIDTSDLEVPETFEHISAIVKADFFKKQSNYF